MAQRGSLRPLARQRPSWVLTVVHNRAIDAFRRETAAVGRDVRDDETASRLPARERTEVEAERRDEARQIRAALQELPAEQRQVIELAYFGGFTHPQISEMLGLPAGTVKSRMRLGLGKLRITLAEQPRAVL